MFYIFFCTDIFHKILCKRGRASKFKNTPPFFYDQNSLTVDHFPDDDRFHLESSHWF